MQLENYTSIIDSLEHAMSISAEDRTHLADLLLASVSDDDSADVDASWDEEIRQRVAAVHAGTAQTVPADEVHAQARRLCQGGELPAI